VFTSLDHHGIPRHGQVKLKAFVDPAQVKHLYCEKHWSYARIANYVGVGHARVREALVKQGIEIWEPTKPPRPRRKLDHYEDVVVRLTMTGKKITRQVAILECGHKCPSGKTVSGMTDPDNIYYSCAACAQREEGS
jgi:hypothetical protein